MAKILIVDDEIKIRETVSDALNIKGYQVSTAASAQEALAIVPENAFDLILLDINLDDESGIFVLKEIRKVQAKLPIVIYSGVLTTEIEKEARIAGANEVLSKDTGLPELIKQIGKIISARDIIFENKPSKDKQCILVVDDKEDIRLLLKDFFKQKGIEVFEAECGEKALELARREDFAAVLLDIHMPGLSGTDTLKQLLEIKPGLGVVMVTGSQDDKDIKEAMRLGAYGYVLKPFEFLYLELVVMSKLKIAGGS